MAYVRSCTLRHRQKNTSAPFSLFLLIQVLEFTFVYFPNMKSGFVDISIIVSMLSSGDVL